MLTLAGPCGALLLPAFFAYAFPRPAQLLGRTLVFYVGLAAVLVPLGMGSAQASRLVYGHQAALTTAAGTLLIALGLVQLGRSLGRTHGSGGSRSGVAARARAGLMALRNRLGGDSVPSVLVLGAVSGLGGFCTGPILGGVLTLAAASGTTLRGAALLAVFAAGMTAPLALLAALWDRFDLGRRRWLRPVVGFGRFRVAVAPAVSGLIFGGLGGLFLYYRGAAGLTALFQPAGLVGWETRIQAWVVQIQAYVADLVLLAALAVLVVAVAVWRLRRTR
ncbi:MAG: cytochrome c biogenesis protein CcdA [Streptosporangiales bacterium]|nr:cytochrome c biogenesis protein CcdA [Streptosporangiales bacterium]